MEARFSIDFDQQESYVSGRSYPMGIEDLREKLRGYRIDSKDGFVILDFEGSKYRKIPLRRLLRVTDV